MGGKAADERAALAALGGRPAAITIAYPIGKLQLGRNAQGDPTVAGTLTVSDKHTAPPTVSLFSYQLTGTVLDSSGHPVANALVSTRTPDRDYWTVSTPSDSQGQFSSLFTASDESGDNPVPMTVKVAIGNVIYSYLSFEFVRFPALHSAHLVIHLPPANYPITLPASPTSYPGALYQGVVVGVSSGTGAAIVRPLSATWPDAQGPLHAHAAAQHSRARRVSLWEAAAPALLDRARGKPGGAMTVSALPAVLPSDAALGVQTVQLG